MQEIVDFLASQPPFDALTAPDLQRLARHVKVTYVPEGTVLVEEGAEPLALVWVIRSGQVGVYDRGRVVDVLGVGDVFGDWSVLSGMPPALTVKAVEDSVCYQLPDPRTIVERAEDLRFTHLGTMISRQRLVAPGVLTPLQSTVARYTRPLLWAQPGDTVAYAARLATERDSSCVLIATPEGLGIATDRDFRSKVATGLTPLGAPLATIASTPATTVGHTTTVARALLTMVEQGIHHLVVTDDAGAPMGIVRAIDLGSVDVRDPLLIRSAIESATDLPGLAQATALLTPTLAELTDNGVPAAHASALMTAIVEAALARLLRLTPPPGDEDSISWLVQGSLARREPLPASDVDTALVWADTTTTGRRAEAAREYAATILEQFERCGLQKCPNGANADNPLFSRSASEWATSTARWISSPLAEGTLLLSSIVADNRPLTNAGLGRVISDTVRSTAQSMTFRERQLRFAVANKPPVGFVREFVTDHRGEHKGGFDLKRGGLVPITALARWMGFVVGDVSGGTIDRIGRGRSAGLLTAGEADDLAGAFDDIFTAAFHLEISALRADKAASTWVSPRDLDPLERRHLRESFRAVSAIQVSLTNHWRERFRRAVTHGDLAPAAH